MGVDVFVSVALQFTTIISHLPLLAVTADDSVRCAIVQKTSVSFNVREPYVWCDFY